nr:MAG TPA: hypothetical protein [Caudoviricetes sp.]
MSFFYKCIFDFIPARANPCPTSSLYDNLSTARFSHFIGSLKKHGTKFCTVFYIILFQKR